MRVALTGGTGFIGRRVARMLREQGHDVVCVVRTPAKAAELVALGCSVVQGDILDRASLLRAFAGCEAVLHVAASYEIGLRGADKARAARQNVEGTRNALSAAREVGAKRIVYTSSIVVYGWGRRGEIIAEGAALGTSFPTTYAQSKTAAHQVALDMIEDGAPIVVLQPAAVLGTGDQSVYTLIWQFIARGLPPTLGDSAIGLIDVEDCARAHVLALTQGKLGGCYHLVAENLSIADMARRAQRACGMRERALVFPTWLLKANAAVSRLVEVVAPLPRLLSSELLGGMGGMYLLVDDAKARAELGFVPRSLDEAGTWRTVMREAFEAARRTPPRALLP